MFDAQVTDNLYHIILYSIKRFFSEVDACVNGADAITK
jgi:hypothetical protein